MLKLLTTTVSKIMCLTCMYKTIVDFDVSFIYCTISANLEFNDCSANTTIMTFHLSWSPWWLYHSQKLSVGKENMLLQLCWPHLASSFAASLFLSLLLPSLLPLPPTMLALGINSITQHHILQHDEQNKKITIMRAK